MQSIQISSDTFAALQSLARPFVDTPDDVIRRLIAEAGAEFDEPPKLPVTVKSTPVLEFSDKSIPALKFAVVQSYQIAGEIKSQGVYWSTLIADLAVHCAANGLGSSLIVDALDTPACLGASNLPGYQYVPEAGISFQQLNSDRSFEQATNLSKLGKIPFSVTWRWSDNPKASNPGVIASAGNG